jgi:HTH-like domain
VREIGERYDLSIHRACGLFELERSSYYYVSCREDDVALRMRVKELAAVRVRFGYRRLHTLLRRQGWRVNHKKVYRIYLERVWWYARRDEERWPVAPESRLKLSTTLKTRKSRRSSTGP